MGEAAELRKKRTFRKYTYRGVDLDQLLDMNNEGLMELFTCRIRRKFSRGMKRKPMALIKKLRKKKKAAPVNEKPDIATTTKIDVSGVKVPDNINDKSFARVKAEKGAKKDGEIFDAKKEEYKPSEQRKKDQVDIDTQVLNAIKKDKEGSVLKKYLGAPFALSKGQ